MNDFPLADEGYGSLASFAASLFLAAFCGALAFMAASSSRFSSDFEERYSRRTIALNEWQQAYALLESRDGLLPDGVSNPVSPVFSPRVTIRDLSSRINPNWFPASAFDSPGLSSWFLPESDGSRFGTIRWNNGPTVNPSEVYGFLWPADIFRDYMTGWSPWPINCADVGTLTQVFSVRTGDEDAAKRFGQRVQEYRHNGRTVGYAGLQALTGTYSDTLVGIITAEPPINVNAVPPEVLRCLLLWQGFTPSRSAAALESLLSLRESRSLTAAELPGLLGVPEGDMLLNILGDRTLVWEIQVCAGPETLVTRCLRLYERGPAGGDLYADPEGKPSLRVISREWVPAGESL